MKKFIFISNMYPSMADPTFGTFIETSLNQLRSKFNLVNIFVITRRKRSILKIFQYFFLFINLTLSLLKNNFDFIYAHYLTHSTYCLIPFLKIRKCIINIHGFDFMPVSFYQKILSIPNRYLLNNCKLIVAPSEFAKSQLLSRYPSISSDKVFINYSGGIDSKIFKLIRSHKTFDFIYISRVDSDKGWRLAIQAIISASKKYPSINFAICGHGSQADELLSEISNFSNIVYLGPIVHSKVPSMLNKSRFLLFPSRQESLGLIALESLACGVPVVSYNIRPMSDYLVNNHNSFLFDNFDVNSLLQCINSCMSLSRANYELISDNCIVSSRPYDSSLLVDSLYKKINNSIL